MSIDYQTCGIKITRSNKAFCHPDWNWRSDGHWAYNLVLWLVVSGRGTLRMPEGEREIRAGDLYLFRMWRPHFATHDPANPLIVPYAVFQHTDEQGKPFRPPEKDLPAFHRRIETPAFFGELLERVISAHHEKKRDLAAHWLRSCLLDLLRRESHEDFSLREQAQLDKVNRLCLEMQSSPGEAPRVSEAAEQLGYSTDYFIRMFRKYKKTTPGEYLLQCRIRSASELLLFSDRSVSHIAEILGYRDIYAFSKQFRNRMGVSPSAYRRRRRQGR